MHDFPFDLTSSDLQSNSTFQELAQAEWDEHRSGNLTCPYRLLSPDPSNSSAGPLTIATGNAACFLPLPVIAPSAFEGIATRYESQDPAAHLPENSPAEIVAGYAAQQKAMAAAMRSRGSGYYNLFLRGGDSEGAIVFLHPTSRGTVYVDPREPYFAEPFVDYRTLSNPADVEIEVEFVKFTRRYFAETRMSKYGSEETRPGAKVQTEDELREYVFGNVSPSTFHPVGTAAMMPRELAGVVDQELRVYGVRGLSVVDASVMPDLPGAYTQQTVYAIAEKVCFSFLLFLILGRNFTAKNFQAADLIKARA